MKIAFLVTHLLGTGHLARTSKIADAFARAGHEALVLSGGRAAPLAAPKTARLLQLPPVHSDATFTALYEDSGTPASEALLRARIGAIRDALHAYAPDVLVTELFPFGRRKLTAEFEAAIAAAGRALILSSIRDILQPPRKTGRKDEAESRFSRLYHGALFHGDNSLAGLSESWPLPDSLRPMIHETGYIGEAGADTGTARKGDGEILVSAGGGAVGDALFGASVAAASLMPGFRWRLLVGGSDCASRIAALGPLPGNACAEPVRPDFHALLARCRVAVLQCGYNTALDVVATGARAVFCPFEGEGETEQLHRAGAMARRYGTGLIREGALTAQGLAEAIAAQTDTPKPDYSALKLNGAARSVEIVETMLREGS